MGGRERLGVGQKDKKQVLTSIAKGIHGGSTPSDPVSVFMMDHRRGRRKTGGGCSGELHVQQGAQHTQGVSRNQAGTELSVSTVISGVKKEEGQGEKEREMKTIDSSMES